MLAAIASGHADAADLLFLVAAIVFGVVAVIRAMAHSVDGALVGAGLCLVSIAWLIL